MGCISLFNSVVAELQQSDLRQVSPYMRCCPYLVAHVHQLSRILHLRQPHGNLLLLGTPRSYRGTTLRLVAAICGLNISESSWRVRCNVMSGNDDLPFGGVLHEWRARACRAIQDAGVEGIPVLLVLREEELLGIEALQKTVLMELVSIMGGTEVPLSIMPAHVRDTIREQVRSSAKAEALHHVRSSGELHHYFLQRVRKVCWLTQWSFHTCFLMQTNPCLLPVQNLRVAFICDPCSELIRRVQMWWPSFFQFFNTFRFRQVFIP
jgi:hypothetical protein